MAREHDEWVARVLGARIVRSAGGGAPGGKRSPEFAKARDALRDAMETVDGQIDSLAHALRATGAPVLKEIAEYGLNAVTANHKVKLMAAIMSLGAGSPEAMAKGSAKALGLVRDFRTHIETDARVAACDANPLDLPVSIRDTLKPALAQLEAALASSAGN